MHDASQLVTRQPSNAEKGMLAGPEVTPASSSQADRHPAVTSPPATHCLVRHWSAELQAAEAEHAS
jgi:hypothetical protein